MYPAFILRVRKRSSSRINEGVKFIDLKRNTLNMNLDLKTVEAISTQNRSQGNGIIKDVL